MTTQNNDNDIEEILVERAAEELAAIDIDDLYDDMLDECYSFEQVGGPFESMCASRVLREVDPTAYRCGFNDFIDAEGWVEIDGEYYNSDDVAKLRQEIEAELAEDEDED